MGLWLDARGRLKRRYRGGLFGPRPVIVEARPQMTGLLSQLVSADQMESPVYARWAAQMKNSVVIHRKLWEFAYILQGLEETGCIAAGKRGLGFGVGKEPIPALLAAQGCELVVTDLPPADAMKAGWVQTNQYADTLDDMNEKGICDREAFHRLVRYRYVDMNDVPDDLTDFDFTWSSSSMDHLGTIEKGLRFLREQMKCLKPGGFAVHTTEYNATSNGFTLDNAPVVIFRRRDIEALARELMKEGHELALNFTPGDKEFDRAISLPPYEGDRVMKIRYPAPFEQCIGTSIGFIIRKAGGGAGYSCYRIAEEARARGDEERKALSGGRFEDPLAEAPVLLKERIKHAPVIGPIGRYGAAIAKMPTRVKRIEERLANLGNALAQAPAKPEDARQTVYLGDHTALTTVHGLKMYVDTRDVSLTPHLMLQGEWESWITRVFLMASLPEMTVVDVGANVGYYTLLAARAVGPQGKVFAFEPAPRNFELMRRSVEVNGFTDRVRLERKAVAEKSGSARLQLSAEFHGGHSLFGKGAQELTVETVSLDEFFPDKTRVHVVKIDVEGAEWQVFSGMSRVIRDNPHIVVILEFANHILRGAGTDPKQFLAAIRQSGFPLMRISPAGTVEPISEERLLDPQAFEYLFLRKDPQGGGSP